MQLAQPLVLQPQLGCQAYVHMFLQVCKHKFEFTPLYAKDTPTTLPWHELVFGLLKKAVQGVRLAHRVSLLLHACCRAEAATTAAQQDSSGGELSVVVRTRCVAYASARQGYRQEVGHAQEHTHRLAKAHACKSSLAGTVLQACTAAAMRHQALTVLLLTLLPYIPCRCGWYPACG